jgi:hypothetical protein
VLANQLGGLDGASQGRAEQGVELQVEATQAPDRGDHLLPAFFGQRPLLVREIALASLNRDGMAQKIQFQGHRSPHWMEYSTSARLRAANPLLPE